MRKSQTKSGVEERRNYYWDRVRKYCKQFKNFDWSATELVLNLAYTHDVFLSYSVQTLAEFNLSISAMNILIILKVGNDEGYKQQDLSGLLLVSRANITKVIDGLEERRLVTRSASQNDRRARFIKLTKAGSELANRIIPLQNSRSAQVTSSLSKSEKDILNKLLTKLSAKVIESGNVK